MNPEVTKIEALHYYATKFQRIRVDRAHGVAPHKPILLLAVMELIAKGYIPENRIYLSPKLIATFLKYWSYLGSMNHNPDISRPFFHMRSGKFWHLMANPGFERVISSGIKLKTFAEVKQAVKYSYVDEDLFDFLCEPKYRDSLLVVLVSYWFPGRIEEIKKISKTDRLQEPLGTLLKSRYDQYRRIAERTDF
jgi:putative restriction endonuclease